MTDDPAQQAAPARSAADAPRVGLVLGAGGTLGQAYQAGVLAALEHDLGWDPRTATVITGTSAGSITGTLLRLGIPAHDLAAWAVRAPLSVEGAVMREWLGETHPKFPPVRARHWIRGWRLPPRALVRRILRQPRSVRPSVLAMTLLPAGRIELRPHTSQLEELAVQPWPDGLWVCAARRDDGDRVVFGRAGSPSVQLPDAVAASCAIPGYFAPIEIDGQEYFDGGVHSPTNADLLRRLALDLVITVAPMSIARGAPARYDRPLRLLSRWRLDRELDQFGFSTHCVRFEPGAASLAAMGPNLMATDRSDRVVQEAFVEAGAHAAREVRNGRLAGLNLRQTPTAAQAVAS